MKAGFFFTDEDTPSKVKKQGVVDCSLCTKQITNKVLPIGNGKKKILILASEPSQEQYELGSFKTMSWLKIGDDLEDIGIDIEEDCVYMTAVNCGINSKNTKKDITDVQIASCRNHVLNFIKDFSPHIIIPIGTEAMKSLLQHRLSDDTAFPNILNWQGHLIPDVEFGAYIIPVYDRKFVHENNRVARLRFEEDLQRIKQAMEKSPVVKDDLMRCIEIETAPTKAKERLAEIYNELMGMRNPRVAFDYETTGLKPFVKGHSIRCVGLSWHEEKAFAFLLDKHTLPLFKRILKAVKIKKIAHNMKYEHLWSIFCSEQLPKSWLWDTRLSTHVLDHRRGVTGLKFQMYVNFGIIGYDSVVKPFLESENPNALNRVYEAPTKPLLTYCAYDALGTFKLFKKHYPLIKEDKGLYEGYTLLHEGLLALADAEMYGMVLDSDKFTEQKRVVKGYIEDLQNQVFETDVGKIWKKKYGSLTNLNSPDQMAWVLKDVVKADIKTTTKGNVKTDKETLENINEPFVELILKMRKYQTILSTYLTGIGNSASDGVVHPTFNLHNVISYRSSCSEPNLQNIPKRDKESQQIVRKGFLPKKGFCFTEVDFSGIEVRISATYHNDPNMIIYLKDPTTDMHRDTCMDLFMIPKEQVTKYLRNAAKNGFVFAEFYGDWYKSCANIIWNKWISSEHATLADGTHVKKHLAKNGIKNLEQFTDHVKEVERIFWEERFGVYNQWREKQRNDYLETGEFRSHTGFRYKSLMGNNDVINYGTQGAAFHCLLWSLTVINERLKANGYRSFIVGQIHDAINLNIAYDEINEVMPMIHDVMTKELLVRFPWINVPIDVEAEMSPLNTSWCDMKVIEIRKTPCKCGTEWGYKSKQENGSRWECPICEEFSIEK